MNDHEARAEMRYSVAQTMTNISIYPKQAQAALWGSDLGDAIEAVADHLTAEGFRK